VGNLCISLSGFNTKIYSTYLIGPEFCILFVHLVFITIVLVSEDEAVVAAFANRRIEVFVLSLEEYYLRFWSHLSAGGKLQILAMINVKIFTNIGIVCQIICFNILYISCRSVST
jgi:hypothetical protein